MDGVDAMEFLIDKSMMAKTNEEFFEVMKRSRKSNRTYEEQGENIMFFLISVIFWRNNDDSW